MKFVLIVWLVSKASMAITSAQFDDLEKCKEALQTIQNKFPGEAITVGGECFQAK
jgi:hypothetical protein